MGLGESGDIKEVVALEVMDQHAAQRRIFQVCVGDGSHVRDEFPAGGAPVLNGDPAGGDRDRAVMRAGEAPSGPLQTAFRRVNLIDSVLDRGRGFRNMAASFEGKARFPPLCLASPVVVEVSESRGFQFFCGRGRCKGVGAVAVKDNRPALRVRIGLETPATP